MPSPGTLLIILIVGQSLALFYLIRRLATQQQAFHDLSAQYQAGMADLRSLRAVTENHAGQALARIFTVVQNLPVPVTTVSLIDGVISDCLWAAMGHMKYTLWAAYGDEMSLMPERLQRVIRRVETYRQEAQQ